MCRKLIYLISFVLVLSLAGAVQAGDPWDHWWTNAFGDNLWSTAANWEAVGVPTVNSRARIRTLPGPTIADINAVARYVEIAVGDSSTKGAVTMNSGTLTVSATPTPGGGFTVAYDGVGTLNMNGGTITVQGYFSLGRNAGAIGHVNLYGGTINSVDLQMEGGGPVCTMDIIGDGTLILNGNQLSTVQGYIDNGWITADGGTRRPGLDYNFTNAGKTTLRAVHFLNPNPADGSTVNASVNQLQWTLPEPSLPGGVVDCVVYFGTNPDVEANPKVVIRRVVESVSVTLAPLTTYYWALDLYDSGFSPTVPYMLCPIFRFNTFNQPPFVNAGDDVATWLVNGLMVVQLDGVVSDEGGGPGPATLLWTVIAEPNELNPAQISDPHVANPTVTVRELGSYTLQLEASDGEFTATDTMQIVVYADSCEHAQKQGGFAWLAGDINHDCKIDLLDLADMAASWLQNNYSTE